MKANNETRRIVLVSVVAACLLALWLAPAAQAKQVKLDVALGNPVVLAGEKQTGYLRVAMKGFELDDPSQRTPVNVAIVLDKSGSMSGQKIAKAKEAAIMAIQRLRPDDIVSVVMYDHTVKVVVPATKVSDREAIFAAIRRINAGGNTALFAGVSKGAHEVRKFLDDQRVNRVILLSDGLANTGPSSPGELAALGESLGREGISVTTIGLGLDYNEDLLTRLAHKSDGGHMFAEHATAVAEAFERELGAVLSVAAKDVEVVVECPEGVRPVRVLGREADVVGQTVKLSVNQLYSKQMTYLMLEVELPPGESGERLEVAKVDVSYRNMATKSRDRLQSTVSAAFTDSRAEVKAHTDQELMMWVVREVGTERSRLAVRLRDEGKMKEARQVLRLNNEWYEYNAAQYDDEVAQRVIQHDQARNDLALENLEGEKWKRQRKVMRGEQHDISYSHLLPSGS